MFDGMPEQFYQFLAAATTTSRTTPSNIITTTNTNNNTNAAAAAAAAALSIPLSFSLHQHQHQHRHGVSFPTYSSQPPPPQPPPPPPQPTFDTPYGHLLQHHHHHHHHPQFLTSNDVKDETVLQLEPTRLQNGAESQRSSSSLMLLPEIPWSNDEMLALFRIRSSMDNTWFPDFIWENVSSKLAEVGFKRGAEKCKEKFEEETRSFNSSIISNNTCNNKNNNIPTNNNNNNNYRLFGELEELCNNNNHTNNNINIDDDDNVDDHDDGGGDDHRKSSFVDRCDDDDLPLETCLSEEAEDLCEVDEANDEKDKERPKIEDCVLEGDDGDKRNDDNVVEDEEEQSAGDSEKTEESTKRVMKKRKRQKKFEMFKGFCEKIVSKMMAQQEELHYKIIQDMVKRDEEKVAKEEAWKRQEFERLEKELEVRAYEQAVSGDWQTKILSFLKKFNTSSSDYLLESQSFKEALEKLNKVPKMMTSSNSSIFTHDSINVQLQPTSSCTTHVHSPHHTPLLTSIPSSSSNENLALDNANSTLPLKPSSMDNQASQNPNPLSSHQNDSSSKIPSLLVSSRKSSRSDHHTSTNAADHITNTKALESQSGVKPVVGKDDTGRRWPRDEVLALINIRCSLFNNNNNGGDTQHDTDTYSKGPLWERISQKMMELGYKRSAKRCKEKWENINKYFRKTKDLNKKRSVDSRTCPYYHQLSHLYSQGSLMGPTNVPGSPENRSMAMSGQSQGNGSSTPSTNNGATNTTMHASQGNEASVVQVPGFDFEF